MPFAHLSAVQHRLQVGQPVPFNVRDPQEVLLLARGQPIASAQFLHELIQRGALVDLDELQPSSQDIAHAPREQLPRLWNQCLDRVGRVLREASLMNGFCAALDEAALPVLAMIERDGDLAIFQVLRGQRNAAAQYGIQRSVHAAIAAALVAQRLGWDSAAVQRALKAGLTMNLSMLELQGELAQQTAPLSDSQRAEVQSHPMRSLQMLQRAGVGDTECLQAVADHHETLDGSGYPRGTREVGDLAVLLQRTDVYTAKLSARNHRLAMAADRAGRTLFMQDPSHPVTAALVKEFGLYPPGCFVRLASGEVGMVVRRGPRLDVPRVAAFTAANGANLPEPVHIDTAQPGRGIVAVLGEHELQPAPDPLRLIQIACI